MLHPFKSSTQCEVDEEMAHFLVHRLWYCPGLFNLPNVCMYSLHYATQWHEPEPLYIRKKKINQMFHSCYNQVIPWGNPDTDFIKNWVKYLTETPWSMQFPSTSWQLMRLADTLLKNFCDQYTQKTHKWCSFGCIKELSLGTTFFQRRGYTFRNVGTGHKPAINTTHAEDTEEVNHAVEMCGTTSFTKRKIPNHAAISMFQ